MDDKERLTLNKQVACLNCGKLFEYDSKKNNRKFCDINCRNSYYGISNKKEQFINKKCKYCEKDFKCSLSTPNKVFCCNECSKAFHSNRYKAKESNRNWSETRKCSHCGKEFTWHSNKSGQKYCSKECLHAVTLNKIRNYNKKSNTDESLKAKVYLKVCDIINQMDPTKGSTFGNKYINYWEIGNISEKTREQVLERDNYECVICKRKDSLHLHHLIKRKYGGSHNAENLVTLCASCHRHIETGDIEHATNKCFYNAKRYFGFSEQEKETIDIIGLRDKLNLLFNKIKDSCLGNEVELLILLDETIDLIDEK